MKSRNPKSMILMNPGPVNVSRTVRQALNQPDLCHREEEFNKLSRSVRGQLLKIFGISSSHEVALFTASGTAAVEAMLSSYGSSQRSKVLVLSNGVYGERLSEILKIHRVPHRVLEAPLGDFPCLKVLEALLKKDRSITAIAMVHHETSTGMLNPLAQVASLAKKYHKTLLLDAVSSLGAEEIDFKKYAIGYCAASSGKCLHSFPGISFVFVSRKEALKLRAATSKKTLYLDIRNTLEAQEKESTPFTPAVQLFYAFNQALKELEKETLKKRIRQYAEKCAFLTQGLEKLGIAFCLPEKSRSHVLSALWLPCGVSYQALHAHLKKNGFIIYAGQSRLKNRIFRVSNLGEISLEDLKRFLGVLSKLKTPPAKTKPRVIVLAAGVGRRFGSATRETPKCLLPLPGGETLLSRYLDTFRKLGLRDVVIVVGHLKEKIKAEARKKGAGLHIRFVTNPDFLKGSIVSLHSAGGYMTPSILIMDADVFFPAEALGRLLYSEKESAFLIDTRSKSSGEEMMLMTRRGQPAAIAKKLIPGLGIAGEATGIVKLSAQDAGRLREILKKFVNSGITGVEYEESYTELMKISLLSFEKMSGFFWTEIDFKEDLKKVLKAR